MTGVPEGDHSIKTVQSKGAAIEQASGGKIPFAISTLLYSAIADRAVATLSMSGRPQEAGTHSRRTGNQIPQ